MRSSSPGKTTTAGFSPLDYLRETREKHNGPRTTTTARNVSGLVRDDPARAPQVITGLLSSIKRGKDQPHIFEKILEKKEKNVLKKWEQQNKEWEQTSRTIAARVGKPEDQLLSAKIDEFRAKQEEINLIERSIPPQLRFGERIWEMSLRNPAIPLTNKLIKPPANKDRGGSPMTAVQYISIGNPFPYPIFTALKERIEPLEFVSQPQEGAKALRTGFISQTDYYKSRKRIYEKYQPQGHGIHIPDLDHLKLPDDSKPPQKIPPLVDNLDVQETNSTARSTSHVHPLSARTVESHYSGGEQPPSEPERVEGPHIRFSEERLSLHADVEGISVGTLIAENLGSVVIHFRWQRVYCTNSLKRNARDPGVFYPCDEMEGAILPGTERSFQFAFRSRFPGVFTERWQFLTDPVLSEDPFTFTLRGVAVTNQRLRSAPPPQVIGMEDSDLQDLQHPQVEPFITSEELYRENKPEDNATLLRATMQKVCNLTLSLLGSVDFDWDGTETSLLSLIAMLPSGPARSLLSQIMKDVRNVAHVEHLTSLLESQIPTEMPTDGGVDEFPPSAEEAEKEEEEERVVEIDVRKFEEIEPSKRLAHAAAYRVFEDMIDCISDIAYGTKRTLGLIVDEIPEDKKSKDKKGAKKPETPKPKTPAAGATKKGAKTDESKVLEDYKDTLTKHAQDLVGDSMERLAHALVSVPERYTRFLQVCEHPEELPIEEEEEPKVIAVVDISPPSTAETPAAPTPKAAAAATARSASASSVKSARSNNK